VNVTAKPASHMATEILEAPDAVARQERNLAGPLGALVRRLKAKPPRVVVTAARGSSAHAAAFAKHAIERHLGIPVAAAAPSIVTVYHRDLNLKDQLLLAISQSGRSDDLIEQTKSARRAGALTIALVNATDSPLAAESDIVLPIGAGVEQSIAATKSFIATLAALLRLTAEWAEIGELAAAIPRLPERLKAAADLDWSACFGAFTKASSLMVIGRGSTLAIAREAALKLKETCNIHAEAYSGAEFQHGPMALVSADYPILMFMPSDEAAGALVTLAAGLRRKHAALFRVERGRGKGRLPALPPDQPEADAICQIQCFYAAAVGLAKLRGVDADRPRHLKKVTRTR
jgi:glucosamine--fructose-6-phosphate aminotransferase (isomerizing)